jgi:hypothetical protein
LIAALRTSVAVTLLACAWMHVAAGRASAECFGETDPWPSFRAAVPTAQRIISGEVLPPDSASGSTGYLAAFRFRVIDVLRGPVPAGGVLPIVGLRSGLPLTICSDSEAMLLPGDVVVFAFDALGPDGVTRINTLAYIRKAGASVLSNVETITPAELERIAATAAPSRPAPPVGVLLVTAAVVLLTLFTAAVFLRRTGSDSAPP